MTNEQFAAWRTRHFRSQAACARALGLDRDTVTALESGITRKGNAYPVPSYIARACRDWTAGFSDDYDGGAVVLVCGVTESPSCMGTSS